MSAVQKANVQEEMELKQLHVIPVPIMSQVWMQKNYFRCMEREKVDDTLTDRKRQFREIY